MKFMILVKANKDSEAGVMPSQELLTAMGKYNEELVVLGAILLTGYLGGATATHVRVGDPFFMTIVVGVALWAGLYLRDERLRTLIPLRS